MNIKEQWIDNFEELLWQHHTCDWDAGNRNPDYPYQLAVAHFDWGIYGLPACSVREAFNRYLDNQRMNKWLKLSDLPNDFWGECFVGTKCGTVDIKTVKILDGAYPVWYSEHLTRWLEFNSKVTFRIMPIELPRITKEDFK